MTWHVVVAADGTVFAVFPARQRAKAEALAMAMSRAGATWYADTLTRKIKPTIGTRV